MGNERFPPRALEAGTPKRITGREKHGAHHEERLALAQLVADIAELSQPRIMEVIDMEIVERAYEAGQGGIKFDQSDKRKQQRQGTTDQRQVREETARPLLTRCHHHGIQSARNTLNSPGDFDNRSDTQTSRFPSGEN